MSANKRKNLNDMEVDKNNEESSSSDDEDDGEGHPDAYRGNEVSRMKFCYELLLKTCP